MNYEDFITGSIFSSLTKENSLPLAGLFLCASGSIRTMIASHPSSSVVDEEEYEEAASMLSYLLYALDKTQWINHYYDEEERLIQKFESEAEALVREERRSHLQSTVGY